MYAVHGFLTPAECAALQAAGLPGLHRSIVVDGQVSAGSSIGARCCGGCCATGSSL